MAEYIIPAPAIPTVAVAGAEKRFPVRRIFCVGRNYAAHAREMGKDPDREKPFFFMKPADTVVESGATIPYPPETKNLHFEMELVVAIGAGGENIEPANALNHVFGYAAGIDLTRRDLQNVAKDLARPWDWSKGFDNSAPCGPIQPAAAIGHPNAGRIWLVVDGETKQDSDIAELIWPVPDIVSFISASMALAPGDLIFTGTPAGVGPVKPGETLTGGIDGVGEITIQIAP
jgi:fumarylpyruvate hydrolase